MATFRPKVKTVQAEQWDGTEEHALKLGLVNYEVTKGKQASGWAIYKSGSYTFVSKSDWIIGTGDDKKSMAPEEFHKKFEIA